MRLSKISSVLSLLIGIGILFPASLEATTDPSPLFYMYPVNSTNQWKKVGEEWPHLQIETTDDQSFHLRGHYDATQHQLFIYYNGQYFQFFRAKIKSLVLEGQRVFALKMDVSQADVQLFQALGGKEILLLQAWPKKLKSTLYYSPKDSFTAYRLPTTKKAILHLFGLQQDQQKQFARKEKLSFKSKQDLIRLFDQYQP